MSHGLGFGTLSLANGALIVLAAAVLQGIFHTAQKPLLARYTSFEVTAYAMWAGTVFILPWTGSLLRALSGAGPHAGGAAIGSAVFLGVAPSAVGFVLWAYAMARLDVGRVTLSLYLVPAVAIGIALAWLGQVPGPVELAGGVIALAGVILASRSHVPAGDEDGKGQGNRAEPGRGARGHGEALLGQGAGEPGAAIEAVRGFGYRYVPPAEKPLRVDQLIATATSVIGRGRQPYPPPCAEPYPDTPGHDTLPT